MILSLRLSKGFTVLHYWVCFFTFAVFALQCIVRLLWGEAIMCTLPPLGAPQFGEGGASTAFTHPPKPPVYPPPAPQNPFFRTPSPSPTSIAMHLKASAHFVHFIKKGSYLMYDGRQGKGADSKRECL